MAVTSSFPTAVSTNFIVDNNRPFARVGNAAAVYYDPETTILTEDVPFTGTDNVVRL